MTVTHTESLDCPCRPVTRDQLGGGRVQVHRTPDEMDGRQSESNRAPDRHCPTCDGWHHTGHPHLDARTLEDQIRALPAEGRRHVGEFIERAAVLGLLRKRAS